MTVLRDFCKYLIIKNQFGNIMKKRDIIVFLIMIGVVILFFLLVFSLSRGPVDIDKLAISGGAKVGVLEINGVIYNSRPFVEDLERFLAISSIKALVIRINSPGGGVAASQEMYFALKRAAKELPVVVSMGGVAASGGYYAAIAADTIIANPGTTTGSIGVIAQIGQWYKLMEKIGLDNVVIKSGRFKDTGNPWREMNRAERDYLQGWIDDTYEQFIEAVSEERNMSLKEVKKVADGRVFTGRQALELGLVDRLGDFQDAIDLAGEMAGIKGKPEIIEKKKRRLTLFDILFGDLEEVAQKLTTGYMEVQYLMP